MKYYSHEYKIEYFPQNKRKKKDISLIIEKIVTLNSYS